MDLDYLQIFNLFNENIKPAAIGKLYEHNITLSTLDENAVNNILSGKAKKNALDLLKRKKLDTKYLSPAILLALRFKKFAIIKKLMDENIDFVTLYFYAIQGKLASLFKCSKNVRDELEKVIKNSNITKDDIMPFIDVNHLNDSLIYQKLMTDIKNVIKKYDFIGNEELIELFPAKLDNDVKNILIGDLLTESFLLIDDKGFKINDYQQIHMAEYIPLKSAIMKLDERSIKIIDKRFAGNTLESIGNNLNITKERVRQIVQKAVRQLRKINIVENKYLKLMNYYFVSYNEFYYLFGESRFVYNYLLALKENNVYLEDNYLELIVNDENVDEGLRKRANELMHTNKIKLDGQYIDKKKSAIALHIFKTYAQDPIHISDLYPTIKQYELPSEVIFGNERSFKAIIERSDYCLHGLKYLRYYDRKAPEVLAMIEQLDFYNHEDVVLSASYFFERNIELMNQLDIRNEYELYDILKYNIGDTDTIDFVRSPIINFGKIDAKDFFGNILLSHSPIKQEDLYQLMYQEYGWKKEYINSNYIGAYSQYLENGVYNIFPHKLAPEVITKIKKLLYKEIYSIGQFQKILKIILGKEYLTYNNNYNLNELGYKKYAHFYLNNIYSSIKDYLISKVNNYDEPFQLDKVLTTSSQFHNLMKSDMKHELALYELDKNLYVSNLYLQKLGVTLDDLTRFKAKILNTHFPKFYTALKVRELIDDEVLNKIEDNKLLSSIINQLIEDNNNRNYDICGVIFSSTQTSGSFLNDAIISLLYCNDNKLSLLELKELLLTEYGIKISEGNLVSYTTKNEMYIKKEVVYLNMKSYLDDNIKDIKK